MGLRSKLREVAVGKITAVLLKKAAEGALGPQTQLLYWFLVGKKGYLALVLGGATAALAWGAESGACGAVGFAWCGGWALKLTGASTIVVGYLSQVDGALRTNGPGR